MPPQPVLDLATLDLKKRAVADDELRKLIPHRGQMAFVDGVIAIAPDHEWIVGYRDVRDGEFWSAGHFPGNPIMPGIIMIEAAGQLSICFYKLSMPEIHDRLVVFGGIDDCRFRGMVRPGDRVYLIAKRLEVNRRLAKCLTQGIVNGKVVYEGTVIGIPT